ncbi:MAG: exosortase/archaeosortase family protein [Schlesneria sp.]
MSGQVDMSAQEVQMNTNDLNRQGGAWFGLSVGAILGICVLVLAFFGSDIPAWLWMYGLWMTSPDNSHGILVPAFAIWLLWHRRDLFPSPMPPVSIAAVLMGACLIVAATALRCSGIYTRTITLEALSLVPCIAGVLLLCGGWSVVRWSWPAVLFLFFMTPLPGFVGGMLSGVLQTIATISSTYLLQTIGIPAVSEGNVIWLTHKPLGVAQACSGLRMLTSFFALSAGMSLVIDRPVWEKCLIALSAPVIAIAANVLRISATAVAYEFGNEKMAELIFHDLAGWLMMPVGLLLLWAELYIISKIFVEIEEPEIGGLGSLTV